MEGGVAEMAPVHWTRLGILHGIYLAAGRRVHSMEWRRRGGGDADVDCPCLKRV